MISLSLKDVLHLTHDNLVHAIRQNTGPKCVNITNRSPPTKAANRYPITARILSPVPQCIALLRTEAKDKNFL